MFSNSIGFFFGIQMKLLSIASQSMFVCTLLGAVYAALIYLGFVYQLEIGGDTDSGALVFAISGIAIPYMAGCSLQRLLETRRSAGNSAN